MKSKESEILKYCLGSKQEEIKFLLTEIKKESFADGSYSGQNKVLDFLGISPAIWSDLKKGKRKIKII